MRCQELQVPKLGVPVILYSTCDCLEVAALPCGVRFAKKSSDPTQLVYQLESLLESEQPGG